jgi:ankyrin repeat protein
MRKFRRIFAVFVCALSFIFIASIAASAQQIPPSYGFLETVDYKNQPVADASVRQLNRVISEEPLTAQGYLIGKTNQRGLLEKGIAVRGSRYGTPFSIDKEGFYPFVDCFGLFDFLGYGWRNNKDKPLRIELLIIPQTTDEKKAVGDEQRKRELFLAIYKDDAAAVGRLLKAKINPNITTGELRGVPVSKNVPAIIYAADLASIEAIKELLSAGVKIRAKDSPANNILLNYLLADTRFYSPLNEKQARRLRNYEDGVQILLDAGANVRARDERDYSLLMIAAEKGYSRAAEILLENGLSDNERNQKDLALLAAVRRGFYENRYDIARLLLKNGANPNFRGGDDNDSYDSGCASALMAAVESSDLQMVELLVANGADVNLICKNGNSAFSKALDRVRNFYYDKSLQQKSQKIMDFLFASGLNVKAVDNFGETLLMKAVQSSNYPVVERLIKMGVPVNAKNKRGETALMLAASAIRRLDIVKSLIEAGADVNVSLEYTNNYEGNSYYFCHTPLANAAAGTEITDEPNDLTDVMQLLVSNGAKVNFKCGNGETALTMAARSSAVKGVEKLLELGADAKGEQGKLALKYAKERLKADWRKRAERVVAMLEAAGAKE